MSRTSSAELVPADQFVERVVRDIERASSHIWVLSMIVNEDDSTAPFFAALTAAAERGVDVRFAADTFTFTELGGRMSFSDAFVRRVQSVVRLRRTLRQSNVDFHWLGSHSYTLFTGRTHMKWVVIDDIVYSFGGINLYDLGLQSADYLLRVRDAALAQKLTQEHLRIINANRREFSYRSHSFTCNEGEVLVDGGFIGNSLIYDRACDLAQNAERITCVSQYYPTGRLARLLRKTDTTLYVNTGRDASIINRVAIWFSRTTTGLNSQYLGSRYVHAKYTIFYYPDGTRAAITGSHNFVHAGEILGTKEIALETTNASIIDQLEAFTATEIAAQ